MDALLSQRLVTMTGAALNSSDIEEVRRILNNLDAMVDEAHQAAHTVDEHLERLKRINRPLFETT